MRLCEVTLQLQTKLMKCLVMVWLCGVLQDVA